MGGEGGAGVARGSNAEDAGGGAAGRGGVGGRAGGRGGSGTVPRDPEAHIPLKPAYFHILLSLADRAVHGYGVRQEVEERTGGTILLAAGTLYEALQRLQRDGLVEETAEPTDAPEGASSRWRFYRATPLGRRVLDLEVARLEADVAAARARLAASG